MTQFSDRGCDTKIMFVRQKRAVQLGDGWPSAKWANWDLDIAFFLFPSHTYIRERDLRESADLELLVPSAARRNKRTCNFEEPSDNWQLVHRVMAATSARGEDLIELWLLMPGRNSIYKIMLARGVRRSSERHARTLSGCSPLSSFFLLLFSLWLLYLSVRGEPVIILIPPSRVAEAFYFVLLTAHSWPSMSSVVWPIYFNQ